MAKNDWRKLKHNEVPNINPAWSKIQKDIHKLVEKYPDFDFVFAGSPKDDPLDVKGFQIGTGAKLLGLSLYLISSLLDVGLGPLIKINLLHFLTTYVDELDKPLDLSILGNKGN